jgi:hypothetical protein
MTPKPGQIWTPAHKHVASRTVVAVADHGVQYHRKDETGTPRSCRLAAWRDWAKQNRATLDAKSAHAEASRIHDHRQALESLRLLAKPLEAPDPVPVIDAKLAQLDVVFVREWEEYQAEAEIIYVESRATLEDARRASLGEAA